MVLAEVRTWRCRFPLPRPFRLGRATIADREYVVVRVETDDGIAGCSFALTRGAPVDTVVRELVAPVALGIEIDEPQDLHGAFRASLPHHAPEGLVLRAQSLLDVAAWDARGKACGQPVWQLLGAARDAAPVMLVEGYAVTGEADRAFAERIAAAAAEGYSLIKLANLADEPERMTRRLRMVRELVGSDTGITVDVGYAWSDHDTSVGIARGWADFDLTWIEDPMHGHDVEAIARLRHAVDTPIAVGDEVTSQRTVAALVAADAVDVLRLDANCAGGITGILAMRERARAAGRELSTHIYPEIHRHFAFADMGAGPIEAFRPDTPFDAPHQFVEPPPVHTDVAGTKVMRPPAEPGLGVSIDWERVEHHSVRSQTAGGRR